MGHRTLNLQVSGGVLVGKAYAVGYTSTITEIRVEPVKHCITDKKIRWWTVSKATPRTEVLLELAASDLESQTAMNSANTRSL